MESCLNYAKITFKQSKNCDKILADDIREFLLQTDLIYKFQMRYMGAILREISISIRKT